MIRRSSSVPLSLFLDWDAVWLAAVLAAKFWVAPTACFRCMTLGACSPLDDPCRLALLFFRLHVFRTCFARRLLMRMPRFFRWVVSLARVCVFAMRRRRPSISPNGVGRSAASFECLVCMVFWRSSFHSKADVDECLGLDVPLVRNQQDA